MIAPGETVQSLLEEVLAYIEVVDKEVQGMPQSKKLQEAKKAIESVLNGKDNLKSQPIRNYQRELDNARAHIQVNAIWRKR